MSQVIIAGDTSGTITLQAPAVSGSTTLTLPAATGTVMVSGNMPAFSAYLSSNQSGPTSNTYQKIQLNTEDFDTANCFDNATNYRFTPTVAGYYQINLTVTVSAASYGATGSAFIYKNGTAWASSTVNTLGGNSGAGNTMLNVVGTSVSSVIYFNGSTDYVEFYAYQYGFTTTPVTVGGRINTFASGCLIRSA
jgi:hypothetical protein